MNNEQKLREALEALIEVASQCDSWQSFPHKALDDAEAALAATAAPDESARDKMHNEGVAKILDRLDYNDHDFIRVYIGSQINSYYELQKDYQRLKQSPSPAAREDADKRRGGTLYEAVQRACDELPEGYEVRIELENGCGMVVWYDDCGTKEIIEGDGWLCADVEQAIDDAAAHLARKGRLPRPWTPRQQSSTRRARCCCERYL